MKHTTGIIVVATVVALLTVFAVPLPVHAALVNCGVGTAPPCTPCDIFQAAQDILNWIVTGITIPLATFMIVLAGGMMLLGGANPSMYSRGKKLLFNTLIGVTIILLAWLVTNFLITSLASGSVSTSWNSFTCPATLQAIPAVQTQYPAQGQVPFIPPPPVPKTVGVLSPSTQQNLCATTEASGKAFTCYSCQSKVDPADPAHQTFGDYMRKYASGAVTVKLLDAIMFQESSCSTHPPASGAGAYGLMQMQPATANVFRAKCGIGLDENGHEIFADSAFLTSDKNTEKIVCLAAAYLQSLLGSCGSDARSLAANYNGSNACAVSRDCTNIGSCAGGPMKAWECPWNDVNHNTTNDGFIQTRAYAPKVGWCATH